ncbi:uncharacterized protein [Aegilops tauschii subsp. strangulata]|uniref:uncharacterized protein n=1 Tax=Aegilops tauschii subsp. strangulata TaxID=200361 RepID=UPI003CC8CB53
MCYGVYFIAKKLKQYFQEHVITVVSTAPLGEIIGCRDASGRVAKWALELADHTILYEPRTTIKSQALADFLIDWTETQYLPPPPDSTHWHMHFDGSKMRLGLGAGIMLSSPKGDRLQYALQIHFELGIQRILCYGDSDLVVQQSSGEWDAHDSNMASYRFLVQKLFGFFVGCEFLHVPRAENEVADTLAKIASSWQYIPSGVSLEHPHKPSIKPSPDSESIHRRASAYNIINNKLVKRSSTGVFQRCLEQDKGIEILLNIHQGECGHHAASRKRSHQPASALQTIPIAWPFAVWGLDMVGPFKTARGSMTHLRVVVEKFTKWIEARPIKKVDGSTVV